MESNEGLPQTLEIAEKPNPLKWTEASIQPGKRTNELLKAHPGLGRLRSIRVLEHLEPNADTGIILFPGGLDHVTDNETLELGHEQGMSVFHIKYPADSSFSVRREVTQALDHIEGRGVKKCHIVAGSWGGIPAFNSVYKLIQEGNVNVDSFFTVAAAFQPSDLAVMVREVGGRLSNLMLFIKKPLPGRQIMARISRGVPDFEYNDPEILKKIAEIPTTILVPTGGKDWWVDARRSHRRYFPNAHIIEYPIYSNLLKKIRTAGGHDSSHAISGIRQIEKAIFNNPQASPPIPEGFKTLQ